MVNVVSELDFQKLIKQHLKPTFRNYGDWAVFYADAYDDVYDTHEYISQMREEIDGITNFDKAQLLYYINSLEPKVNQLMGLMNKSEYKSQYYNRLWSELSGIRNEIPAIRSQLNM
jgi:hypothetical protein